MIEEEYYHRSWKREDGLPENDIVAVAQTTDGYIWAATPTALARFDGTRFLVVNRAGLPQLGAARNRALTADRSGGVWFTTDSGIVACSMEGLRLIPATRHDPPFQPVVPSSRGGVWTFLTVPHPRIHHVQQNGAFTSEELPLNGRIPGGAAWLSSAGELPDGRFWFGEQHGLFMTDANFAEVEEVSGLPEELKPYYHTVTFDSNRSGYDLLGSSASADRPARLYRIENGHATLCATNVVNNSGRGLFVVPDRHGNLWMPAGVRRLYRYRNGGMTLFQVPGDLVDDYIFCLCEDRDGNLWFGSTRSGLHYLHPRRVQTLTIQHGLAGREAECFAQTPDGSVWIGTDNGLTRFDGLSCMNFHEAHGLARRSIRSLAVDQEGVLWAGTLRGVHRFENGRFSLHAFPGGEADNKIRAIIPAGEGGLWAATARGLYRICEGQHVRLTVAHGLSTNDVLSLVEGRGGILWAGTAGAGLNRLSWNVREGISANSLAELANVTITILGTTNGLANGFVRTLHEDDENTLWIGTDGGLTRYKDGVCTTFTVKHGLPEDQVNALLEDGVGRFWIGGDRNVYQVSRHALNRVASGLATSVAPVRFGQPEGFSNLEVSGKFSQRAMCTTRDGRIWIGTAGGAAIVAATDLSADTNAPVAVIEQVRANGSIAFDNGPMVHSTNNVDLANVSAPATNLFELPQQVPKRAPTRSGLCSGLRFRPGSARIIEIGYTAPTFVAPQETRFRYRLEGWDKGWVDGGSARKAYYANLRPGSYRFRVAAAGRNGGWSETEASFLFEIEPFFHETVWFYAACGICLSAFASGAITSRLRKTRRIAELERQIALDAQRKRIARDIHDELGASLTQIAQLSADALETPPGPAQVQTQARRIAALAEEAVANIGEIVWANNPRYDSLEDLVAYMREYAAKYLGATSVESRFTFPEQVPAQAVPGPFRQYLLAILKEALHNLLKHSGATKADVVLSVSETHLEIAVHDDGVGIQPGRTRRSGHGLVNIRERAFELNGSVQVESVPGRGTTISVKVPLPRTM